MDNKHNIVIILHDNEAINGLLYSNCDKKHMIGLYLADVETINNYNIYIYILNKLLIEIYLKV